MKTVTLQKVGDELLLELPADFVEESGIKPGDLAEIEVKDGEIIIRPAAKIID